MKFYNAYACKSNIAHVIVKPALKEEKRKESRKRNATKPLRDES